LDVATVALQIRNPEGLEPDEHALARLLLPALEVVRVEAAYAAL